MKIKFKIEETDYIIEDNDRRSIFNIIANALNKYIEIEYIDCAYTIGGYSNGEYDNKQYVLDTRKKIPYVYTYFCSYKGVPTPYGIIVNDVVTVAYHTNKLIALIQADIALMTEHSFENTDIILKIPEDYFFQKEIVNAETKYKKELKEIKRIAELLEEDITDIPDSNLVNIYFDNFANDKPYAFYSTEKNAKIIKEKKLNLFSEYRKREEYLHGFIFELKKWKIALNVNQDELSEILKVPKRTIGNWESGSSVPLEEVQENVLSQLKRIFYVCVAGRNI